MQRLLFLLLLLDLQLLKLLDVINRLKQPQAVTMLLIAVLHMI